MLTATMSTNLRREFRNSSREVVITVVERFLKLCDRHPEGEAKAEMIHSPPRNLKNRWPDRPPPNLGGVIGAEEECRPNLLLRWERNAMIQKKPEEETSGLSIRCGNQG